MGILRFLRRLSAPVGASLAMAMASRAYADVTPAPVISDGMVLQADGPAPLFGTAQPGERVVVEVAGQRAQTVTGPEGRWLVRLSPAPAGGPFEVRIEGKNLRIVKNVLFGEVWLASGQSNMLFPLKMAQGAQEEIPKASRPKLRYYRARTERWEECTPDTAGGFSALAYFFGVALQAHRGAPVGIIDTSVNGAVIQTFISQEAWKADPELAGRVKRQTDQEVSGNFERYFRPLVPYAIRGALWCQGEGNRGCPTTYRQLLPLLVGDWRKQWDRGEFPFLIVQLVNSQARKEEPWEGRDCAIREIQLEAALRIPQTALVVTIDLGIQDVHYPNKKPAGERLALAVRALAYGEPLEYSGPVFQSATFEGGRAVVSFTHRGTGLHSPPEGLSGFLLAGLDRRFVRASARVEGDQVIVSSPAVPAPVAVRYAWERNPACNLTNQEGLPASPFRSDRFDSPYFSDETK
jgi:sialate O-acetylesterase